MLLFLGNSSGNECHQKEGEEREKDKSAAAMESGKSNGEFTMTAIVVVDESDWGRRCYP
jgi:hypothetical protein